MQTQLISHSVSTLCIETVFGHRRWTEIHRLLRSEAVLSFRRHELSAQTLRTESGSTTAMYDGNESGFGSNAEFTGI